MTVRPPSFETRSRKSHRFVTRIACATLLYVAAVGCDLFSPFFGPLPVPNFNPNDELFAITIVQPTDTVVAAPGASTFVQWADLASTSGTTVRLTAQLLDAVMEPDGAPIDLIGDGTIGSGVDALTDGAGDFFELDLAVLRVGDYSFTVFLEAPDGETDMANSFDMDLGLAGIVSVTSALPVPTLTFTAPGGADESVTTGNTFDITWTDNGDANPAATLTLGLDIDDDPTNGNEIILESGTPLSDDGNAGMFTFAFMDENGAGVPDGSYTVFAIIDDLENQIVQETADGMLVLNP